MTTASQIEAHRRKLIAAGGNPFSPQPLPEPPEKAAGMADEITYLRSRGFTVTAGKGEFLGWWKVDGNYRSTEWVIEKVAGLKARSLRNAPPPVKLTGDAPVAIVSTVAAAEADDPEIAAADTALEAPVSTGRGRAVDYRGLGADGVRECLQALLPHFPNAWVMGGALGDQKNFSLMLSGKRTISQKIVNALYGPTGAELLPKWLELIAGGPVTVPQPGPDGPGSQAGYPEPTPQLPSGPDPIPDTEAPAAEPAPLSPPSGAGEPEAAAGDGAAASTDTVGPRIPSAAELNTAAPGHGEAGSEAPFLAVETAAATPGAARAGQEAGKAQDGLPPTFSTIEIPAGPDAGAAEDVAEEPAGDAVTAVAQAQAPRGGNHAESTTPPTSPVPGGDVTYPAEPWSQIEDRDLLPILRGKAAGMAAEIAEIEAEYSAGVRALEALSRRARAIERRRAALLVAIDHFENDPDPAAAHSGCGDFERGASDGDEGEAA